MTFKNLDQLPAVSLLWKASNKTVVIRNYDQLQRRARTKTCQGEGRGSESRLPLKHTKTSLFWAGFFFSTLRNLPRCIFLFQRRTLLSGQDLIPAENRLVFRKNRNTLPFFKRRPSPFVSWLARCFVHWTKWEDEIFPSLPTHCSFVRWTKRKTTFPLHPRAQSFVHWTLVFPASEGYNKSQVQAAQENGKDASNASEVDRILCDERAGQAQFEKDAHRLLRIDAQLNDEEFRV